MGNKVGLQRVYGGEGTFLISIPPARVSMKEYLALSNGPGGGASGAKFLADRVPVVAPTAQRLAQLEGPQSARKRRDFEAARGMDGLCRHQSRARQWQLPPGWSIGMMVKLSSQGLQVEEGYDWSDDPLRPGEEARLVDPEDDDENEWGGIQPGPNEVCIVCPRGEAAFYNPGDLEPALPSSGSALPSSGLPQVLGSPERGGAPKKAAKAASSWPESR